MLIRPAGKQRSWSGLLTSGDADPACGRAAMLIRPAGKQRC